MVYLCHLITPLTACMFLAITYIPYVNRGLLSLMGGDNAGVILLRILLLFTIIYITQVVVDRTCEAKHCSRQSFVRSSSAVIRPKLSSDQDFLDSKVEESTGSTKEHDGNESEQ